MPALLKLGSTDNPVHWSALDLLQQPSLNTETTQTTNQPANQSKNNRSVAQIDDQVLINLSFPFET